jgi:RHS repeat-associated protein
VFETTQRFVYDGEDLILAFSGSTNVLTNRYLYGPATDEILADERITTGTAGTVTWSLGDNLGTIRDLVQYNAATGTTTVVNHIRYDTFGQIVSQTNSQFQPWFAYTGREWDPAVGLYFYRARWYDPRAGRFTSEDPLGFAAGDVNLSRYVGNGPTLWVDPSGMAVQDVSVSIDVNDELPSSSGNQGPPTLWQEYCYYLNNPSAMGPEMESVFYVFGGIGIAAGAVAGGVLIAGSVSGVALLGGSATFVTTTGVPTVAGNAVIGMGSAGLIGGTVSKIGGGGFITGGVRAAPAGFIGGGASSLASIQLGRAGFSGLVGSIAADGFGGAAAGAVDSQLRGNTMAKTLQAAFYGFVAGGVFRAGLHYGGPLVQTWFKSLLNWSPKRAAPNSTIKPGQVASAYPRGRRVGGAGESVRPWDPPAGFREAGAWELTPENQRLMEAGRPPIGFDGLPVELHHRGQSPLGPLDEMTATTHDTVPHPRSPSEINRSKFAGERARYWRTVVRILLGQE